MVATHFDFVNVVVADRDLVVTSTDDHACRLEPRESDLAWYCDLDDGTPTGENDPASSVRWVSPSLRVIQSAAGNGVPLVDVRRSGPRSDLGKLMKGLWRLAARGAGVGSGDGVEGTFVYTDPAGILDPALRRRIENWPSAHHAVQPAELWSIELTREGLVVLSASWWNSAPALDHQIGLAIDIARKLTQLR